MCDHRAVLGRRVGHLDSRLDALRGGGAQLEPGLVETEFSVVRFDGDQDRAGAVYEGLTPLSAVDVAELIAFIVTRPPHVNLATTLLLPRDQATVAVTHRS